MMKSNITQMLLKKSFVIQAGVLLCSLLWMELLFRVLLGLPFSLSVLTRIILFNVIITFIIAIPVSFLPYKASRTITLVFIVAFALYTTFQLGYHNYMHIFMSVRLIGYGVDKVTDYVVDFIRYLSPLYFLSFLPCLSAFYWFKLELRPFKMKQWQFPAIVASVLPLIMGCFHLSLYWESERTQLNSVRENYLKAEHAEVAITELGLFTYLARDVVQIFAQETGPSIEIDPIIENDEEEIEEEKVRSFDDTEWIKAMEEEENSRIKAIDEYLISRPISQYNDYTGIFEGKNVIFIMVEAFDYAAIHEELTPTLYMMFHEGMWFTNFYSPQYSCATAESELIGSTSLVPASATCTASSYYRNDFSISIYELFKEQGYYASSYHNWDDEFYPRSDWHESLGSELYLDIHDLDIKIIKGWQSDKDLIEQALPYFIDKQPFFTFIITSSMHMPYDVDSALGKKYLSEINEVYPNAPAMIKNYISKSMEYDRALELLIQELEARGILEDTVIIMYADHHPLKMPLQYLKDYSFLADRDIPFGMQLSPMVIYNAGGPTEKHDIASSTYDLVPTIANLFDLNFDPRYYMGVDYFSTEEKIVIFANGSWISSEGYYEASKGKYTSYTNEENDHPNETNQIVKNRIAISQEIFKTDYFKFRHLKKIPSQD